MRRDEIIKDTLKIKRPSAENTRDETKQDETSQEEMRQNKSRKDKLSTEESK